MTCPACGSGSTKVMLRQEDLAVLRCRSCGHAFGTGGPSAAVLYDEAYYRDHYASRAAALQEFFAREARRMPPPRPGARLLDVGSGIGLFLHEARSQGWSVLGIEPSAAAVAESRNRGLAQHEVLGGPFQQVPLAEGAFDAVTFWDSLAHIEDLRGALAEAWRLLVPGGTLLVKTPHRPLRLLRLARWLDHVDPRASRALLPIASQVHHFTPKRLGQALAAQGFAVASWRWSTEAPHPRRASTPRQALRRGMQRLGRLVSRHPSFIMVATRPAPAP